MSGIKCRDFCLLSERHKRRRVVNEIKSIRASVAPVPIISSPDLQAVSVGNEYDRQESQASSLLSACDDFTVESEVECNLPGSEETFINLEESCYNSQQSSDRGTNLCFDQKLRNWVSKHNISQAAVSDLLKLLRENDSLKNVLPSDCRSLMKTPRNISSSIKPLGDGKYMHFGLLKYSNLLDDTCNFKEVIKININIDGLPISKSSGAQFWPILGSVCADKYTEPFPIGIYFGMSKPSDPNLFLEAFVNDILEIKRNKGVDLGDGRLLRVEINAVICDAPARSFILGVKNHTGYFGCLKCTCEGDYVDNRVIFSEFTSSLRTNETFRNKLQPEHHKHNTILENLDIDLVEQVPLDYMHLICLGVTKKMLLLWYKGSLDVRLKPQEIKNLSERNMSLKNWIPVEFCRRPRSLYEVDRWKATEFRLFLLYSGPVILKNLLKKAHYQHFLCLSVAIRILCSADLKSLYDYANELLVFFAKKFGEMYDLKYLCYNVHNVIHLTNDVKRHGPLDLFSAFKFENYMYKLKKKLKVGKNPLEQISNRIIEESLIKKKVCEETFPITRFENDLMNIKDVKLKDFLLSSCQGDNCCLLNDSKVVLIDNICQKGKDIKFQGKYFINKQSLFTNPCDSSLLNIFQVSKDDQSTTITFEITDIKNKCLFLPLPNDTCFSVFPLIHGS